MQRLKAMKPYEVPDPAEEDTKMPLGSSVVVPAPGGNSLELVEGAPKKLETAMRRNAKKSEKAKMERFNTYLNRARRAAKSWHQDKTVKVEFRARRVSFSAVSLS